jgi:hypothetical protein
MWDPRARDFLPDFGVFERIPLRDVLTHPPGAGVPTEYGEQIAKGARYSYLRTLSELDLVSGLK